MRVLPALLLVVLLGTASMAIGQEENALDLAVDPPSAALHTNETLDATLTLTNHGVTPLRITLSANSTGFQVGYSDATAIVLPQQNTTITARVRALNASLGEHDIVFLASDDAQRVNATATLRIDLRVPPPPPPQRSNTTSDPSPPPEERPPNPPPEPSREPAPEPTPPVPDPVETLAQNETPDNETTPPAETNTTTPQTENETEPAPAPAPTPTPPPRRRAPPLNLETHPPPPLPEQDNPAGGPRAHAALPRPAPPAPPPPRPTRLAASPDPLVIPHNGTADLHVTLDGDGPATLHLTLPPGFVATPTLIDTIAPASVWFVIRALPDAESGRAGEARASLLDEAAPFVLIVTPPSVGPRIATQSVAQTPLMLPLAILAAALGAAALALRKTWPALVALYSRIPPSRTLAHPERERLHDAIKTEPGLHVRELRRRLGLAPGALDHHLRALERAQLVRIVPDGQYRRVYAAGTGAQLAPPLSERVLAELPARAAHAARALGVSRQAAHYHLRKLAAEGRVRREDGVYFALPIGEP